MHQVNRTFIIQPPSSAQSSELPQSCSHRQTTGQPTINQHAIRKTEQKDILITINNHQRSECAETMPSDQSSQPIIHTPQPIFVSSYQLTATVSVAILITFFLNWIFKNHSNTSKLIKSVTAKIILPTIGICCAYVLYRTISMELLNNKTNWIQNLGNIGAFLSGIGLFVLAFQLYEQHKTSKQQALSNIYTLGHQINKLILEDKDLLIYFFEQDSQDTPSKNGKFRCAAEAIADQFEFIVSISESLPKHIKDRWFDYMKSFYKIPAFKDYIDSHKKFFSLDLLQIFEID